MMRAILLMALCVAVPLAAQQTDTTHRVSVPLQVADTAGGPQPEHTPPISPGRSFLYSFLLPGYAQTVLQRPRAAALFLGFEALAVTMLRQASFDLRQAQAAGSDSVVTSWWNPATNQAGRVLQASPYTSDLIRSRRAHVEDWIAILVANHLFSGIDAYVAAHLWDVPFELQVQPSTSGSGAGVALSLRIR